MFNTDTVEARFDAVAQKQVLRPVDNCVRAATKLVLAVSPKHGVGERPGGKDEGTCMIQEACFCF